MKIIRLSAIILILTLAVSTLAACGGDAGGAVDSSSEQTTEVPSSESVTEVITPTDPVDPLLAKIAENMKNDPNYVIFVIGDSLTQGSGASDPVRLDYTAKFAEKLAKQFPEKSVYRVDGQPRGDYLGIQYPHSTKYFPVQRVSGGGKITVVRCGIGGNTVQKIIDRSSDFIGKEIDGETGDLFIVMSGINDYDSGSYDLSKYASPPKYKANLNTLVSMIREGHPESDIILMTPTTVGKDGKGLDIYAEQVINVGETQSIAVIDQHKLWMDHYVEGAPNYGQGDWLKDGDSCHPTDIGHEAIADEMIRCLFGVKPE